MIGASSRSAAQSLARADIGCVAIDQFGDQDTVRFAKESHVVKTSQDLAERLATYSGHAIVPVGQWPGMIETIQQMDAMFFPGIVAWHTATSLEQLRVAANVAGLDVPMTTAKRVPNSRGKRFLEKQPVHSGGLGVRWDDPKNSPASADRIYQEWMPGRSFGATFLASRDKVQLLGICRTLFGRISKFPFVYRGSFGPVSCIDEQIRSKLLVAAESIAFESGLLGIFNIDFIQSADGKCFLLEVNPRWSASSEIIERSLAESRSLTQSQSLMGISVGAMRGQQTPTLQSSVGNAQCWIKRILFAKHQSRFNYKQALAAAKGIGFIHDIPAEGEMIEPNDPCCTLIAKVVSGNPSWWAKYRAAVQVIVSHDA